VLVGQFYLDPTARSGKRGGAWMDDVRAPLAAPRYRRCRLRWPIWFAISPMVSKWMAACNRPADSHDDVITLFHEFGHGLHHMLTQVNERDVSGISGVEWDAVELPSQFMENFCWEWNVLRHMTAHVDTGEPLPRALFDKMLAARNFQSGMQTLRQIEFALFDMLLHTEHDPATTSCRCCARCAAKWPFCSTRMEPHAAHLQPHLCRWLRGGLLQLQMGRGA
jgi:oligopeptidase A